MKYKKQIRLPLTVGFLALLGTPAFGSLAPVDLRSAGNFVILSKSGITDVPASAIIGNIGTSPITGAAIAGLGCIEVTAGQTTLGTTSSFKGIILCATAIAMQTGASLNGRAMAQTAVTLQMNAVTQPAN